jgi:hypothetical protein
MFQQIAKCIALMYLKKVGISFFGKVASTEKQMVLIIISPSK